MCSSPEDYKLKPTQTNTMNRKVMFQLPNNSTAQKQVTSNRQWTCVSHSLSMCGSRDDVRGGGKGVWGRGGEEKVVKRTIFQRKILKLNWNFLGGGRGGVVGKFTPKSFPWKVRHGYGESVTEKVSQNVLLRVYFHLISTLTVSLSQILRIFESEDNTTSSLSWKAILLIGRPYW